MTVKSTALFALAACLFAASPSPSPAEPALVESYGSIPLAFTANDGRTAPEVAFTTNGAGCGMFFTPTGTTYVLDGGSSGAAAKPGVNGEPAGRESFALACRFIGANPSPEITGEDRLSWNSNYFIGGGPAKWRTDVPNYGKIRLHDLYDGVDLVYYGNRSRLKYDFIIDPGEDPSTIRLQYDFGDAGGTLQLNADGDLVVSTPAGDLVELAPYAYQMISGREIEVEAHYRIIDADAGEYGFTVGGYDPAHELVIDPELVYSTYLGSNKTADTFIDMAVDSEGYVYILGNPGYEEFPVTPGAYDVEYNRLFVTKMNRDGSGLVYSTFFGASDGSTVGYGIDTDYAGNAYISGITGTAGFPVTQGAFDTTIKTSKDAYVTKINPSGDALVYSTFIGGSEADDSFDIAVDRSGNAFITGYTYSADFPVTPDVYDTTFNGDREAFVSKLNDDGTGLIYSTFLGPEPIPESIVVDDIGTTYITGRVYDTFQTTDGAYDASPSGGADIFVTKLTADGSDVIYATFIGGSEHDYANDIVIDSFGNAYICGDTASEDFPTTAGAFDQSYNGGSTDAFITKLNADGSGLVFSSFLGGSDLDIARGITIDSKQRVYVTGNGSGPVTTDIYQGSGFISILSPDGSSLEYATFYGGTSGGTFPYSVNLDAREDMYIAGVTASWDLPVTENAYDDSIYVYHDPENPGAHDYAEPKIFISKFSSYTSTGVESEFGIRPAPPVEIRNYPNPFNASTTISYTISEASEVQISIFNIAGQKVVELVDGYRVEGNYQVLWNAPDVASGLYIARIEANRLVRHTDMILLK